MKRVPLVLLALLLVPMSWGASTYCIATDTGNICLNSSIITGTKINASDVLSLASPTAATCATGNYSYYNGSEFLCSPDTGGAGSGDITEVTTTGSYLTGGATSGAVALLFNETALNATIDARDDDTTYTADGFYVFFTGTVLSFNETRLNATIDARDSDTTYSALSEFTDDLGNRGYTHLSNFTDDLGHTEDNSSWNKTYADTLYSTGAHTIDTYNTTAEMQTAAAKGLNMTAPLNMSTYKLHFDGGRCIFGNSSGVYTSSTC